MMLKSLHALLAAATLLLTPFAAASPLINAYDLIKRSSPPPSTDPFYTAPSNLASYAPGAIITSRTVTLSGITYKSAYQLLYRTTDAHNQPAFAVTTVVIPNNADLTKFLAYGIFYDSPDIDCGPSYSLQQGGGIDTGFTNILSKGIPVSVSDYEGPNGAFTDGPVSGHAFLDSIRATLQSTSLTGVLSSAKVVMWGYSGGALAAEWAAELQVGHLISPPNLTDRPIQPSYAPNLRSTIIGAALGGLTPNVTSVLYTINKTIFSGLAPAGILGLANANPQLTDYFNAAFVSDAKRQQFLAVKGYCLPDEIINYLGQDISSYFKGGFGALNAPVVQDVAVNQGVMGRTNTPQVRLSFPLPCPSPSPPPLLCPPRRAG
jgi:hypothetical protein